MATIPPPPPQTVRFCRSDDACAGTTRLRRVGPRDLTAERRSVTVDHFGEPDGFRNYFKANYGPTIATYRFIADDPGRVAELDQAIDDLARRFDQGGGALDWEYLLLVARKRSS
ncbi:MAG: hypothetical protein WKH47_08425 [Actinomycetes bacterium]